MMDEPISPEVETVILQLQTQLEQKNVISKPNFDQFVSRSSLISKIRKIDDAVAQSIRNKEITLVLTVSNEEPTTSSSSFSSSSRIKLTPESRKMVHFILEKIQRLLLTNTTVTRRDIYYQNVRLFKNQRSVDKSVERICQLLNTPQWNLGLLSTSKGLVYGPIVIQMRNGETIDCSLQQGGTLIPQNLPHGASYESPAKFGLVLEKDTALQNLLSSGLAYPLNSCILITGKGYPDMSTRYLVRDLSEKLSIPMFALVDCDPHGIDIYINYKYGSKAKAFMNEQLAAPHLMWLGIHPTDMIELEPSLLQPMTPADTRKIRCLLGRNYVKDDENLRIQLESLAEQERKCEIENITSISNRFLNDVYLPAKISSRKFI